MGLKNKEAKKIKKSPAVVNTEVELEQDERLEFLLPGHIWRRTDTGQLATVLLITNAYLNAEQQKTFPPQVVYVDAAGRHTSVTVPRFLKNRVFESVNPDVEKRIEQLLDPIEQEEAVSSETAAPAPAPAAEAPKAKSSLNISFESSSNQQMPELPAQELVDAFLQYEQDPDLINGVVRHKLLFSLANLTLDQVRNAFGSPGAVYGTFRVTNDIADIAVEWEEFQGAYPVIDANGTAASLVFLTPARVVDPSAAPVASAADASAEAPVTFEGQAAAPNAPAVTVSAEQTA